MRLCIHGHFYQPPRENPWTGRIERQESAAPDHDWNERIQRQCYAPNGASRLLDSKGRIREIHNNYRRMSFNFGPTLLEWMEAHDPDGYARILEADRLSLEDNHGHGNALAQVYNHAILPLGTDRDRRTQIAWGIQDFEQRFDRRPEGMWLAETAINMDTVVALIEGGVKFTVLAPTQADRVRALSKDEWEDVSDNTIDTTRPYRIYPLGPDGEPLCKGHLDVFFYNGSVSAAIGFEHLLRDASSLFERLCNSWDPESEAPQLVNVATDGESYGHHEPFGDMALAYLFETLCPARKVETINYGRYLELFPPRHEVRLKNAHGEGTAWSCSHGTGRWSRDCGCSAGGHDGWNQAWRTPLREAMALVRDHAEAAWDALAPELLRDPEAARGDFPRMRHSLTERTEFFRAQLLPESGTPARSSVLRLAELVRMGQFCLTSCGWFFDDISGIEPVQNLRYARRACELLESLGCPTPEDAVRQILSKAVSNWNGWSGEKIWEEWVVPKFEPTARLAAHAVFEAFLKDEDGPLPVHGRMAHLKLNRLPSGARCGLVELYDPEFEERTAFASLAWKDSTGISQVRLTPSDTLPAQGDATLSPELWPEDVAAAWGSAVLHLSDLSIDTRGKWAEERARGMLSELLPTYQALSEQCREVLSELDALEIPAPPSLRLPELVVLEARLTDFVETSLRIPDIQQVRDARDLLKRAKSLGVAGQLRLPAAHLEDAVRNRLEEELVHGDKIAAQAVVVLLDLADGAGLPLEKSAIENLANRLRLEQLHPRLRQKALTKPEAEEALVWIETLERLNFDCDTERDLLAGLV